VTPASLVDYLVTEEGVIAAPDREKLAAFHAGLQQRD
jgi:citrate lyase alpha subunit